MSESVKTLCFVAVAALAVTGALLIDRGSDVDDLQELVGQTLNRDFEVDQPKRLRIIKFDRATASLREFEVAEVDGVWSLPSKQNYPADATEQMAAAATSVMNRKILRIADDSAQAHAKYGVVDPLAPKLDAKSEGVGTRVIMTDADDQELVDMIIGKRVAGSQGQRYVRNSRQNVVYVVELDPEKLTTDFADWIKDDLLDLNTFDLARIFINDYSADLGFAMTAEGLVPRVTVDQRHEMLLDRAAGGGSSDWTLASITRFDSQSRANVPDALAEDEEVNQDMVRELVNGLDDLLIVDIAKKPDGLSSDLKAGEDFLRNESAIRNLMGKGFIPYRGESGAEILSSEGEIIATLNNGVEYVLRFGQLQVQTESAAAADEAAADAAAAAESAGEGAAGETDAAAASEGGDDADAQNLRRYLFVMARFNEDAVKRPELKELPPLPQERSAEESAETSADDEADAAEPGEEGAADAADESESDADDAGDEGTTDEAAAEESPPDLQAIMAERQDIEEENQRLMEEYQSTIEAGRKKVAALNERFGDWYYVISNDVYKKLHLGRDQVVRTKPAAEGEQGDEEPDATSGLPDLPLGGAIDAAADESDPEADEDSAPVADEDDDGENGAEE